MGKKGNLVSNQQQAWSTFLHGLFGVVIVAIANYLDASFASNGHLLISNPLWFGIVAIILGALIHAARLAATAAKPNQQDWLAYSLRAFQNDLTQQMQVLIQSTISSEIRRVIASQPSTVLPTEKITPVGQKTGLPADSGTTGTTAKTVAT